MGRGKIHSFCLEGLQGVLFLEDTARLKIEQGGEGTLKEAETVKSLLIHLYSREQSGSVREGGEEQKIGSD